jgi:hypothetical protein
VLITAVGPVLAGSLCVMVTKVAEVAAARLTNPGIGQKVWPAESVLATRNACDLLTAEEVTPVIGRSTRSWPGFGGFSCQWGLPESTTSNVTVVFDRRLPLDDSDGVAGEIAGRPARTSHVPGEQCFVIVQEREYSVGGRSRIEAMKVHVYGPDATTCAKATELATVAQSRLGIG